MPVQMCVEGVFGSQAAKGMLFICLSSLNLCKAQSVHPQPCDAGAGHRKHFPLATLVFVNRRHWRDNTRRRGTEGASLPGSIVLLAGCNSQQIGIWGSWWFSSQWHSRSSFGLPMPLGKMIHHSGGLGPLWGLFAAEQLCVLWQLPLSGPCEGIFFQSLSLFLIYTPPT